MQRQGKIAMSFMIIMMMSLSFLQEHMKDQSKIWKDMKIHRGKQILCLITNSLKISK